MRPIAAGQGWNLLVDTSDLATASVAFLVDVRYENIKSPS